VSEIQRFRSPDGKLEAVLVERQTGATVSTPTELYLVNVGQRIGENPVFVADKTNGLILKWTSPSTITIWYSKARIFRFTNFWQPAGAPLIEIRLLPTDARSVP
jgi:hypothetical protein